MVSVNQILEVKVLHNTWISNEIYLPRMTSTFITLIKHHHFDNNAIPKLY